ncbi:FG-GAP-like repeat-containing protein [Kitasatospora sp. NPDC005856]|uniref:FG-GAP-like repeat-containing protein n=1 Tax=Kitasatospora sp. NPDC005856 TaxID=3154566 RepID=UPI00340DD169
MRTRSFIARLLSLAMLLISTVTASMSSAATASAATATPPPLRFFSYNLCGGNSWANGALCTYPGEVTNRAAYVASEAASWNSDLLFLTEICRSQFDGVLGTLASKGYHGVYAETMQQDKCKLNGGTSASEGVALLTKGADPAPSAQEIYLGEHNGSEALKMICADTTLQGRPIKACTDHPSAGLTSPECPVYPSTSPACPGTPQQRQAEIVRKTVEPWIAAGTPVVLGGDFNAPPSSPSLDSFYDFGGGFGQFTEVDETDKTLFGALCPQTADRCRSGKYTYDLGQADSSKIDHIFLSSRDFTSPYAATPNRNDAVSDHGDLRGAAAWAGCADPSSQAAPHQPCTADGTSSPKGDFNGDGRDDLATVYNDGNGSIRLTVWLAKAGGGFAQPTAWWKSGLNTFDWNSAKAISGDFNGDGKTDIGVLYNYGQNPDGTNHTGLWTFLSTGTSFADPIMPWDSVDSGTGSWNWNSSKPVAGDFNGDGKTDIGVLYNYGQNPDGTNHTGLLTFTSTGSGLASPTKPWDSVDSGTGSWNWNSSKPVAGDFNADGKTDIGVLYNLGTNSDGTNHAALWTFTATGSGFASPTKPWDSVDSGTGSWNWNSSKPVAGDFNGDGKTDVGVLYNYGQNLDGTNHTGLLTFTSTGSGFASPTKPWDSVDNGAGSFNWNSSKVVAGDFNGDRKTDIGVLYNQYDLTSAWFTLTSSGSAFGSPAKVWDSSAGGVDWNQQNSVKLMGAFTGSNRSDLAVVYNYPPDATGKRPLGIWTLPSTGIGFGSPVSAYGGPGGTGDWNLAAGKFVAGDFNGDGKADVGVLYNYGQNADGTNHTGLWTFLSTGTAFAAPVRVWDSVASGFGSFNWNSSTVVAGDFNGDGKSDVGVLYNYGQNPDGTNHTGLWTFLSTGTAFADPTEPWDSVTNHTGSWNWSASKPVAGDFNGDGKTDIGILYNYGGNDTGLLTLLSTGTGFAAPAKLWDSGAGNFNWDAATPVAGDSNGDGRSDISVSYLYGPNSDTSTSAALFSFTSSGSGFNSPMKVWDAGAAGGEWPTAVLSAQLGQPRILSGDINGDGRADLATVHGGGNASTEVFVLTAAAGGANPPATVWRSNLEWARSTAL